MTKQEEAVVLADKIARNFTNRTIVGSDRYGNNYENELAYEALLSLRLYINTIERYMQSEGMLDVNTAKTWKFQLFHDIAYPWFEYKNQLQDFKAPYVQVTDNWINEVVRRESGTITYYGPQPLLGSLIDMLQAYMLRLCRTAQLTNDQSYAEEAVNQYRLYRTELRNEISGCFHQGKGWLENDTLSPSPWSRGQGWIVHGLVHCLTLVECWPNLHDELLCYLNELLSDLVKLQTESGFWHQLIDRPNESYPDTSGSALIFEAIQISLNKNYITGEKYSIAADKAWNILKQQIDDEGFVDQACNGPGTIWEIEPWLNTKAPKGEPHGIFAMLFACRAILQ